MIGMELSGTKINLKYENKVTYEAIKKKVFEHETM